MPIIYLAVSRLILVSLHVIILISLILNYPKVIIISLLFLGCVEASLYMPKTILLEIITYLLTIILFTSSRVTLFLFGVLVSLLFLCALLFFFFSLLENLAVTNRKNFIKETEFIGKQV
jgi:hypothetical protein